MPAHTPGPWIAHIGPVGGFVIEANGLSLCQRTDWSHRADESGANGTLIAASPDLLAALSDLTEAVKGGGYPHKAMKAAEAAIAKATQP